MNMHENKVWYLKQVDLFKGIPDQEIMAIASKVVEKKCQKKELLYSPFEVTDAIYVLKKGEVTLYHLHKGKKLIIDVLKEGSIFGHFDRESGKKTHFAEVTEASYVCIFQVEDFANVLRSKPEVMLRFLQIISSRLAEYEVRFKGNIFDAKEKILNQLSILQRRENANLLNKLIGRKSRVTHEKLAHYTGLTRETVTRIIQELKKEGKVRDLADGGFVLS